jgi:hypothetical protein
MGTSPIGGSVTGLLAQAVGIRTTIAVDGAICPAASIGVYVWLRRARPKDRQLAH